MKIFGYLYRYLLLFSTRCTASVEKAQLSSECLATTCFFAVEYSNFSPSLDGLWRGQTPEDETIHAKASKVDGLPR